MAELSGIHAYTLEDFIRSFRPDGLGHIVIEDFEGIQKDVAFDEVVCDLCNVEISQPEDEPFRVTVFVMDGYALCEECMHRVEDEGEEPSLLSYSRAGVAGTPSSAEGGKPRKQARRRSKVSRALRANALCARTENPVEIPESEPACATKFKGRKNGL